MHLSRTSRKIFLACVMILVFTFVLSRNRAHAASATISVSPSSGSYGTPFTVDVGVDGGGQAFNGAQATVNVSSNLAITNLVLGDCNFSFLSTPGITNPSFSGVILGGSSKKCTVYTLTLNPVAIGQGSISLSNATVKRYGDAVNILSSVQNGTYTITAASTTQAILPTFPQSQNNLYTVVLKVLAPDNTPADKANVSLNTPAGNAPQKTITDPTGIAYFTDVQPGIYSVTAENQKNQEAKNVINVTGTNHTFILSMKLQQQSQQAVSPVIKGTDTKSNQLKSLLKIGIFIGGIVLGIAFVLYLIMFDHKKKTTA